ncbi:Mu-like prophage major head subunit gpT family protein [Desulfuromonas acetoxidans]|uniref:Mu-like prophage major head subunit gpT family protein n=1 Tax=Desulfuromonas acetoxidans TaxID=891 RepID=UPI00292E11F2|nr:Mu-like prophage major head subunit gpT family protein [Desulfuromonas acetoxidans]
MKKILILFTLVMIAALFGSIAFADPALAEPFTWSMLFKGSSVPALVLGADTLRTLFRGFKAAFNKGLGGVTSQWEKIATRVPSTTSSEDYGWLGHIPGMRKWIGDRQINNIKAHGYSIKNDEFEDTIGVPRTAIEDDQYGIFSPLMESMGQAAATHPDELVFELLAAGFETACYDGQYFFDTDHPVIDKDGNVQSVSNMADGANSPWFLLDTSRPLRPIIFQERKKPNFVSKDDEKDDNVFMRAQYVYGVDSRCNVGYGFWQMAYGSKATLNGDNFDAAMQAMLSVKGDHDRKLGIRPTVLVCGANNRAAAKAVLKAQFIDGGNTNTNYDEVELMVVPWLD